MTLKFRAWDKETQTMLDVSLIDFKKSVLIGEHWEFGETNFINFDEIELMQSTGLFVKNGREIFEGDILKINDTNAEVDYDCSCFLVSFIEKIQENQVDKNFLVILTVKELVEDYKVTVIGNVYANPELKELAKG